VWGGATIVTPSQDSVGNVKVLTNAYDAENGRFSGAITQITSKSGTNDIHGSVFVQVVRPGLNAYQRWNGPHAVLRDTDRSGQFDGRRRRDGYRQLSPDFQLAPAPGGPSTFPKCPCGHGLSFNTRHQAPARREGYLN
jgi:hypothetical protein